MLSLFQLSPSVISDFWYGAVGHRTAAGINVTNDVAMTLSTVFACSRVLVAGGSSLPFNLHETKGRNTTIASDHLIHGLIHDEPNPEMGAMSFRGLGFFRQINQGNFFAEIERDALGRPIRLWPLEKERVTPFRPDEQFAREHGLKPNLLAWRVKRDKGGYDFLPDSEMFNVPSIISDNGIIGKGVIENARETIAHGIATVQQGAAYMKNSARPSVVITGMTKRSILPADREYYRQTWMDVHGGPENNAKPAIVPEGCDVKVLSFSPEDSQFLQTMQHQVEDICRWYGVSPHLVQHLLRATFSNIEHQGIDFVVYSLVPWLKKWEEEVWRKLLSPLERKTHFAKHNVNGLLRGDSAARAAYYQSLWQLGAYSINEIRELEDMNPIDDGDEHFIQTSYATIANVINPPEPPAPIVQKAPEPKSDEAMSVIRTTVDGLLDHLDRPQPIPVVNLPDIQAKLPDELAAQIASLIEYTRPPIDSRILDVQSAAQVMVEAVASESLSIEIAKVGKMIAGDAKEFFGAFDTYYKLVEDKLSESLSLPIFAYARSRGLNIDSGGTTRGVVAKQLAIAREQVLDLTSVQADEWPNVRERFGELAAGWKAERVAKLVEELDEVLATFS